MIYKPRDFIYYEMMEEALRDEDNTLLDDHYLSLENAEEIFLNPEEYLKEGYYEDFSYDILSAFRELGEEYNRLLTNYPRHYEVDYHVKEFTGVTENGETISKWVGWNYYYGGGKHAYPEDIDWIPDAEFLKVSSEAAFTVIKRTFEREENNE